MKTYYVGLDVHQASTVIVVLNGEGRLVMETIVETGAERVRGFIQQLKGQVYVTFEEGTQASWLYEVIRPLVTEVVVCNPRYNKLLAAGNKGDRIDARKLAELLRYGSLRAVYHEKDGVGCLRELVRNYDSLVTDTTRVMNRLKAIFRGRALACAGQGIYRYEHRAQWLAKLKERGLKERAKFLYEELQALKQLRQQAKRLMLHEVRRHPAYQLLQSIPLLGAVSVAKIIAIGGNPHRFRSKRQFWAYVGLAVVTRSSAEYVLVNGIVRRSSRPVASRGLNRNHNRQLKRVFKSAARSACAREPFQAGYQRRLQQGMAPSLARLTIARQLAAITLTIWKRGEQFSAERIQQ